MVFPCSNELGTFDNLDYTLIHLIFAQLQISRIFISRIQFSRTPISRTFIFRAPHTVLVGSCQLSSHQRFP